MKHFLVFLSLLSTFSLSAQDWLIDGSSYKSTAQTTHDGKRLGLTNGLLRRTFLLAPNAATIALDNLMTGQNELRAVRPEALLVINGKEYPVGGLTGQPVNNFLTEEFINNMQVGRLSDKRKQRTLPLETQQPMDIQLIPLACPGKTDHLQLPGSGNCPSGLQRPENTCHL